MDEQLLSANDTTIQGDFNLDQLKDDTFSAGLSANYNLHQIFTKSTRITKSSTTLIGHIYLTKHCTAEDVKVTSVRISDHEYVLCTFGKLQCKGSQSKLHKTVKFRSMKKLDIEALKTDLHQTPWDTADVFDDIDNALSVLAKLFNDVWDTHAPIKISLRRLKAAPWISKDINDLRKRRDH